MAVTNSIEVRLLNTLKNKEQPDNSFTGFLINAPLFAVREFLKYVPAGVSVFEFSPSIEPTLFMPSAERGIIPIGDEMFPGEPKDYGIVHENLAKSYDLSLTIFKNLLEYGIAEEIARLVLPLSFYVNVQVTGDLHSFGLITNSESSLEEANIIIEEIKTHMNKLRS